MAWVPRRPQGQGFVAILSGLVLTAEIPRPDGYPENPEMIGEHIRCARMDQGLVQREVGEIIGVTQSTVVNWVDKPRYLWTDER